MKKTYSAPRLIVHGTIEQITQGSGWGFRDFFVFGIGDVVRGPMLAHKVGSNVFFVSLF